MLKPSGGGMADVFLAEAAAHDVWLTLGAAEIAPDIGDRIPRIPGTSTAERVAFHFMVQRFVGIHSRSVGGQVEALDEAQLPLLGEG